MFIISVGADFLISQSVVQTGSGTHPASRPLFSNRVPWNAKNRGYFVSYRGYIYGLVSIMILNWNDEILKPCILPFKQENFGKKEEYSFRTL
jgi:hypothetical protein